MGEWPYPGSHEETESRWDGRLWMAWVWGSVPVRAEARPGPPHAVGGDPCGVWWGRWQAGAIPKEPPWSQQDRLRAWREASEASAGACAARGVGLLGRRLRDAGIWGPGAVGPAEVAPGRVMGQAPWLEPGPSVSRSGSEWRWLSSGGFCVASTMGKSIGLPPAPHVLQCCWPSRPGCS